MQVNIPHLDMLIKSAKKQLLEKNPFPGQNAYVPCFLNFDSLRHTFESAINKELKDSGLESKVSYGVYGDLEIIIRNKPL